MENWFRLEMIFAKELHITPTELDQMEFYRIEYILRDYEEHVKEQNKAYEEQQKKQEKEFSKHSPAKFSPTQMKPPKLEVPKFTIPKM